MTGIDRRLFLRRSAAASGFLLAPSLTGLIAARRTVGSSPPAPRSLRSSARVEARVATAS